MGVIFRHTLARMRNQILGWGLTFAALGWMLIAVYRSVTAQSAQYFEILKEYPPTLMAFFGDFSQFVAPGGYLDSSLLSYGGLLLAILGAMLGSGLILSDEEGGRLELVQAQAVSRTGLLLGRGLGTALGMLAVLAPTGAGCLAGLPGSGYPVSPANLALPYLAMWSLMLLAAAVALCLSMFLPSRSAAASTTVVLLVVGYTITSLARTLDGFKAAARFSPFSYYQGGYAVAGLNWRWCAGLLLVAAAFAVAAWWAYERRDLRVSGEGAWRWPRLR
jgi:ABC-2 type transport system permease protein